jgi:hypothetical protein
LAQRPPEVASKVTRPTQCVGHAQEPSVDVEAEPPIPKARPRPVQPRQLPPPPKRPRGPRPLIQEERDDHGT